MKKTFFSYRVITGRRNKSYYCASHEPNNQTITHKENNLRAGNWIELTLFLITGGKIPLFSLFLFPVRQNEHTSRIELWWHHRHTDHLSVITNGAHSWYSNWSTATEIKTLHCLPFCWPRGFRCAHTAVTASASVLYSTHCALFYFHIDSGSKSAPWGLKHWPWRAALATKTDGNPPANPSSSQPIITSQWPRALLPNPPLSLFLLPPLSRRERRCFPQPYYHFKDFPTKSAHMASALVWWQGGGDGALRFQMSLKVKTLGGEAVFCCFPAKHRGKYSWPDFKVAVGSAARLNRHALSALQSRPIKRLIHRFSERKAFNDLLFPWFNTSIVVSAENRGVILLALNAHLM